MSKIIIKKFDMSNQNNLSESESTTYVISDDTVLGLFDADGSILLNLESYERKNKPVGEGNQPFGIRVYYYVGQSLSKTDTVQKLAEKFGGTFTEDSQDAELRVNVFKETGQKMRQFLLKNKPLHPGRRRDFLISEVIVELLQKKAQSTNVGLVTLLRLAYNNTRNMNSLTLGRLHDIEYWISKMNPSKAELKEGLAQAAEAMKPINQEVALLEEQLPKMELTSDYIRGAHFGDGGFTVSLAWRPNKDNRRRCEPEWTISGENVPYCKAFVNTIGGGNVNSAGKNYHKFRLTGIKACNNILHIFDEAPWMPDYKKNQFEWFKKAVQLLINNEHMTEEGTRKLVQLVYNVSEKGGRSASKEQYIEWGIQWLRNKNSDI